MNTYVKIVTAKVEAVKPIATKAKTVTKPETSSKQKDMEGDFDDSDDDEDDSDDEEETQLPRSLLMIRREKMQQRFLFKLRRRRLISPLKRKMGKKVAHVATPHLVKQAGKGQQSPKFDAKITYKSCTKTFTSDSALQSHARVKHDAK
ncbi:histone deacetylase HDT3-like [Impatiens glandulifera]|uniref:histone deacetylase HDT3-like n=1 Tax=Impatiens glandulifera TaxID=253017 RepID=UPI001FB15B31|nr:histone deacetylase HDT3-like [Impatiens glandulifera]